MTLSALFIGLGLAFCVASLGFLAASLFFDRETTFYSLAATLLGIALIFSGFHFRYDEQAVAFLDDCSEEGGEPYLVLTEDRIVQVPNTSTGGVTDTTETFYVYECRVDGEPVFSFDSTVHIREAEEVSR